LQQVRCPDIELKQAEQRWAAYMDSPEVLSGTCLLHTDWRPENLLMYHRAYLIDWAWPTKGASWIDPACWVVWLIASGHSPVDAESRVSGVPSWERAPARALNEFAGAQAHMWADIAAESPEAWKGDLANAAQRWAMYRKQTARVISEASNDRQEGITDSSFRVAHSP
jgi:hypothetical protein